MNQIATQERSTMNSVGIAGGTSGAKMAPQNLGEVVRFAEVMCRADIAIPKHLRGNAGACMAVAMQALEWNMSPFAVASKSYSVGGAIAYEAQLIAAVVNTRSGIKGRLKYRFDGEGAEMTCTVTGMLDDEECVYTSPTIGSITTKNSPLWKSDPQQQLGYFSARSWARRHCPEVILGVYDRDETESFRGPENAKDVTPANSVMDRLKAAQKPADEHEDAREGFDAEFVTRETASLSTSPNSDDSTSRTVSDDAGESSAPAEQDGDDDIPQSSPSDQSEPEGAGKERDVLIRYASAMLTGGRDCIGVEKEKATDKLTKMHAVWKNTYFTAFSEEGIEQAQTVFRSAQAIAADKTSYESAVEFFEEMLDCPGQIGGNGNG